MPGESSSSDSVICSSPSSTIAIGEGGGYSKSSSSLVARGVCECGLYVAVSLKQVVENDRRRAYYALARKAGISNATLENWREDGKTRMSTIVRNERDLRCL